MSDKESKELPRWVWPTLIGGLPLGLVLFSVLSMILYFQGEKKSEIERVNTRQVELSEVEDLYEKLTNWIPARHHLLPDGRKSIRQAEALAMGTLSPLNSGFRMSRDSGVASFGELWKGFEVVIPAKEEKKESFQVMVPYDLDGEALLFGVVLAQYIKENPLSVKVIIRFYPSLFLGERKPLQFQPHIPSVWVSGLALKQGVFRGDFAKIGEADQKWAWVMKTIEQRGRDVLKYDLNSEGQLASTPESLFVLVKEACRFIEYYEN